MRPDPRLLVPREVLPFVPAGATLEDHDGNRCVVGEAGGPEDFPGCLLDLSAPAIRDGIPGRMDALPWALAVMHPHAVHVCPQEDHIVVLSDATFTPVVGLRGPGFTGLRSSIDIDLTPWPDLTGLTPDEASRAVVAAALRGGR